MQLPPITVRFKLMRRGKGDNQSRAAIGGSGTRELYSQSHFLGMRSDMEPPALDSFPELAPVPGLETFGGIHSECERRLAAMAETVERERGTVGMLEAKCEEYLGQLQRSADIIELGREREDRDRRRLEDKIEDLERKIDDERARREAAEDDREALRRQLDRMLDEKGDGESEMEKIRETLVKRDVTINEQRTRIGYYFV